jgi:hypothetical protein
MDSELEDIARKCKLKWTTRLSGCCEALSKFRLQSARNFKSNGKFSIVGTLDVDIKASRMVCSVVVGSSFFYLFLPAKYQYICAGSRWAAAAVQT